MEGRVAAVFGAGPGIGEASARMLADAGVTVACIDVRKDVASAVAERVRESGGNAVGLSADVRDRASIDAALATLTNEHGRLDAVVDVVGGSQVIRSEDVADAAWNRLIDLNLRQQFIVAQGSIAAMTRMSSRGSYIAIGSTCGYSSSPYQSVYGIAKAGVASMIRSFAVEYAQTGIRFNVVSPGGVILTPRLAAAGVGEGELHRKFCEAIPMGRIGQPEEIAGAVLFLASDLASYMTGQVLLVDGGQSVTYTLPLQAPPAETGTSAPQ